MFDVLKGEGSLCFLEGPLGPSVLPNAFFNIIAFITIVVGLNEVGGDFYSWWPGRTTQRPKIQRSSQRSDRPG